MLIGGAPGSGQSFGAPSGAYKTVSVNAGAGGTPQVLTSRSTRSQFKLQNQDPTITVYWGFDANVTTANGFRLDPKGESDWIPYTGPVYAIADAAGPADVRVLEVFS